MPPPETPTLIVTDLFRADRFNCISASHVLALALTVDVRSRDVSFRSPSAP